MQRETFDLSGVCKSIIIGKNANGWVGQIILYLITAKTGHNHIQVHHMFPVQIWLTGQNDFHLRVLNNSACKVL